MKSSFVIFVRKERRKEVIKLYTAVGRETMERPLLTVIK